MKCIKCSRPLARAAVLLSGHPVGPKCAKAMNLQTPKQVKKTKVEKSFSEKQFELELEWMP
jgi:hypothetical protein